VLIYLALNQPKLANMMEAEILAAYFSEAAYRRR
jgi:hypothetical protein